MKKELKLATEHLEWCARCRNRSGGLLGWTCGEPQDWKDLCEAFVKLYARNVELEAKR